jgi:hypothetical protein
MGPGTERGGGEPLRFLDVRGKVPILWKLTYELRYRQGFAYLDKCGRIINKIQRDFPEWILQGDANPQAAAVVSMKNAAVFSFSSANLALGLEMPLGGDPLNQSDVSSFIASANSLTALVMDQIGLGVEEVTRIGFRPWFLFGCRDQADSEAWLLDLGLYSVQEGFPRAFGGVIESAVMAVVIKGEDRHFRVALAGAERQVQLDLGQSVLSIRPRSLKEDQRAVLQDQMKARRRIRQNPEFVAIVDIDCYQEDPEILDVTDFLQSSWKQAYERFRQAVPR